MLACGGRDTTVRKERHRLLDERTWQRDILRLDASRGLKPAARSHRRIALGGTAS